MPRWKLPLVQALIFLILCGSLAFSALTVNRERLRRIEANRYWQACRIWDERGFFNSFGLWLEERDPAFYRQPGPTRLYAYAHSSTGFIIPIYVAEKLVAAVRGRPSALLFQLYSQVVILAGAFFLALLALRVSVRRGLTPDVAGTLALSAALVFQNFIHNLDRAKEVQNSTVTATLVIVILYLNDRYHGEARPRERWIPPLVACLMLWMALSDHPVNPAFFAVSVGLLSFYGLGPRIPAWSWAWRYALPVASGFLVLQGQLLLARVYLDVPSIGTPLLMRMGLAGSDWSDHRLILTFLRPPWSWFGFAGLALAGLIAILIAYRDPRNQRDSQDLAVVLAPIVTWLLHAAIFSEHIVVHPYVFDVFLIIPSVLIVLVHVPLVVTRHYPHAGVVALSVLMFGLFYVWISLVDYANMVNR